MDPHTYPGRPWPLSTLTVRYTDLYLRKSFQLLQQYLTPDTVIFLGDLFDGGREWSTSPSSGPETKSTDKRWNKYGESFWFREYGRFSRIFFEPWLRGRQVPREGFRGRKMLAGLPGNHDLGFGIGIRLPVRQRFNAYFGDGNRVDVIGNHTFVSLDTVSLSANGQPDPATGSQGAGAGDERAQKIWNPAETFLSEVKSVKARMLKQELRLQAGKMEHEPQDHTVIDLSDRPSQDIKSPAEHGMSIPSVLLTHVPLYRAPGTPCGPLRERFPPSRSAQTADGTTLKDNRNALPVGAGVQYQTVLTSAISNEIMEKVGDVEDVFSGDDHDYCEVIHRGYTSRNGGVREITVKAMSWAAGIRKPGFLMLSLWNPVDAQGKPTSITGDTTRSRTIETHLCLLPDQLSIFMRYGFLFGLTLVALLGQAFIKVYRGGATYDGDDSHILPVSKQEWPSNPQQTMSVSARSWAAPQSRSLRSHSPMRSASNGLAARSSAARTRSTSPFDEYGLPVEGKKLAYPDEQSTRSRNEGGHGKKEWKEVMLNDEPRWRGGGKLSAVMHEWRKNLTLVGLVALSWYMWLLWNT